MTHAERQLLIDLENTVILPLLLVGFVSLWNAVRLFRTEAGAGRETAKRLFQISAGAVLLLSGYLLLQSTIQLALSIYLWEGMKYVSIVAALGTITAAWQLAERRKWLLFAMSIWLLPMTLISEQYASHHAWNALRATNPAYADYILHRNSSGDDADAGTDSAP